MTESDEQVMIVLKFSGKDRGSVSSVEHRMWCYMTKLQTDMMQYDSVTW